MAFGGNTHFFESSNNSEGELSRRFGLVEFKKPRPVDAAFGGEEIKERVRSTDRTAHLTKLWFAYTALLAHREAHGLPGDHELLDILEAQQGHYYFRLTALNAMPLYQSLRKFFESPHVAYEDRNTRFVPLQDLAPQPDRQRRIDQVFRPENPLLVDKYEHSAAAREDTLHRVPMGDLRAALAHFLREDVGRHGLRFGEAARLFHLFDVWPSDAAGHSEGPGQESYFYGIQISDRYLEEARMARGVGPRPAAPFVQPPPVA